MPGTIAEETEIVEAVSDGSVISSNAGIALGAAGVLPASTPGQESEALQLASLTQTLSCLKKIKKLKDPTAGELCYIWSALFNLIFYFNERK